jgi:tetratricopeptide (TPR) repeat protein
MDGTFEAIECQRPTGLGDLECLIVLITAHVTFGHGETPEEYMLSDASLGPDTCNSSQFWFVRKNLGPDVGIALPPIDSAPDQSIAFRIKQTELITVFDELLEDSRSADLFVNMGVSLLENGNLKASTNALQHAVELDPSQPESHFNLGLVYERRNMLTEAEQEMRVTLLMEPGQLDARNMLGVIYARKGNAARTSVEWRDLLQDAPNYSPARANLMMLSGKQAVSGGDIEALLRPSLRQTAPGPSNTFHSSVKR